MRKRSRVMSTRITEGQFQKLKLEAEKQGITVGQLIRRRLTRPETPSEQYKRPYAPKHGRRIRLTPQQRKAIAEKYIEKYPQLLKQVTQQMPQVREPPKTKEELSNIIARDTMENTMGYCATIMSLRQKAQKMAQQKQAKEEKLRRKEERLWRQKEKRIERKTEQLHKLLNRILPLLQPKQEEQHE